MNTDDTDRLEDRRQEKILNARETESAKLGRL